MKSKAIDGLRAVAVDADEGKKAPPVDPKDIVRSLEKLELRKRGKGARMVPKAAPKAVSKDSASYGYAKHNVKKCPGTFAKGGCEGRGRPAPGHVYCEKCMRANEAASKAKATDARRARRARRARLHRALDRVLGFAKDAKRKTDEQRRAESRLAMAERRLKTYTDLYGRADVEPVNRNVRALEAAVANCKRELAEAGDGTGVNRVKSTRFVDTV